MLLSMEWRRGLAKVTPPFFFLDDSEKKEEYKNPERILIQFVVPFVVRCVGQGLNWNLNGSYDGIAIATPIDYEGVVAPHNLYAEPIFYYLYCIDL